VPKPTVPPLPLDSSATYTKQIKLTVQVMTPVVGMFGVLLIVSVIVGR